MGDAPPAEQNTLQTDDLLQRVDRLRELNIGEQIGLPQLVVVGDQSSGKSSLLESLTGIPFPRHVSLCTRYATQITSRRANKYRVSIKVQPGPRASAQHIERLWQLKFHEMTRKEFREGFADILDKVNEAMGIATHSNSSTGCVFSQDVLKIEISGPKEDCLTIIDVPGIFRVASENITIQDANMVRDMVTKYIQDKRTVILAVIPCTIDVATQEILSLAHEHDPKGMRTLGILTKPDLVHEQSTQNAICSLVNGEKHRLALGYYLVRNRGADDTDRSGQSVTALDSFFETTSPWNTLPRKRVGVAALRTQLGRLLADLTMREFAGVKDDLRKRDRTLEKMERALGVPRASEHEQRLMLGKVAKEFEDIRRDATDAMYSRRAEFGSVDELRLITRLVDLGEEFRDAVMDMGHKWEFADAKAENEEPDAKDHQVEAHCKTQEPIDGQAELEALEQRFTRITELVDSIDEVAVPEEDIMVAITEVYQRSRGREIGGYSGGILEEMFKEQSSKWGAIARLYVAKAVVIVNEFITAACIAACTNEDVREKLLAHLEGILVERYAAAFGQVDFLERIERSGPLSTLNPEYTTKYQNLRMETSVAAMKDEVQHHHEKLGLEKASEDINGLSVRINTLSSMVRATARKPQTQCEIYNQLEAYYGVVVRTFIDSVWKQAVEYGLLCGAEAPLQVFSQGWVTRLGADDLGEIAKEPLQVQEERVSLSRQREDVRRALEMLRRQ